MAKQRIDIPAEIAADVLFASDSTCCVCRERGKALQLHHIDEDPSNSVAENIAALCLQCHNDTQLRGGFGRKLNAVLVTRYRDEWSIRVRERRDRADEEAVRRNFDAEQATRGSSAPGSWVQRDPPLAFINALPEFKAELVKRAQAEWDSEVTARVVQASYDYISALQGVLSVLAEYYAPQQFGDRSAQQFLSEAIAARFQWHRTHAEPLGPGTGGTIVNINVCGGVIADVERMVQEFAMSLAGYDDTFDWSSWQRRWRGHDQDAP